MANSKRTFFLLVASCLISCTQTRSAEEDYRHGPEYIILHDVRSGRTMQVQIADIDRIVRSLPREISKGEDSKEVHGTNFIMKNGDIIETNKDFDNTNYYLSLIQKHTGKE